MLKTGEVVRRGMWSRLVGAVLSPVLGPLVFVVAVMVLVPALGMARSEARPMTPEEKQEVLDFFFHPETGEFLYDYSEHTVGIVTNAEGAPNRYIEEAVSTLADWARENILLGERGRYTITVLFFEGELENVKPDLLRFFELVDSDKTYEKNIKWLKKQLARKQDVCAGAPDMFFQVPRFVSKPIDFNEFLLLINLSHRSGEIAKCALRFIKVGMIDLTAGAVPLVRPGAPEVIPPMPMAEFTSRKFIKRLYLYKDYKKTLIEKMEAFNYDG